MNTKNCGCTHDCNCHDQPSATAPQSVVNSYGSHALACRVGTHATLMEALKRRLSSNDYKRLASLRARTTSDPSIALLDAWSTVADVLTFYNERLINEGYLRTATERRSLAELSGLIGYRPGPGVASSVYLAFTLEKDPKQASAETLIPKGTAVKSVPGDGEMPQTFETAEDLVGRVEWNVIRPRQFMPQRITSDNIHSLERIFLNGIDHGLKKGDRLMVTPMSSDTPVPHTINMVIIDHDKAITEVRIEQTRFSLQRIYGEVHQSLESFLKVATEATSFEWMKSTLGNLTTLRTTPPLSEWSSLSSYDERLTQFMQRTDDTDPAALVTREEIAKPDSAINTVAGTLTTKIRSGYNRLVSDVKELCAVLSLLDNHAIAFITSTNTLRDIIHAEDVDDELFSETLSNAKTAITALKWDTTRSQTQFPTQTSRLNDFYEVVRQLTASNPEVFKEADNTLRNFWGISADSPSLTRSASNLNQLVKRQTHSDVTNDSLFASCVELSNFTIEDASERSTDIQKAFTESLNVYSKTLQVTFSPPLSTPSLLIQKLADFISTALKTINNAKPGVLQHQAALSERRKITAAVEATRSYVDLVAYWTGLVDQRRELFALEARRILDAFGTLKNFDRGLSQLWSEIEPVLERAHSKAASKEKYERYPALQSTIDRIDALIPKVSAFVPSDDTARQIKAGLLRELSGLTALNGGGAVLEATRQATDTSSGGIVQAVTPEATQAIVLFEYRKMCLRCQTTRLRMSWHSFRQRLA